MFSVTWVRSAENELARMWADSPEARNDLARISEEISRRLARSAAPSLGLPDRGTSRTWVYDTVVVSFDVILDDGEVRVTTIRWANL